MHWEQKVQHASLSDIGLRRKNNEDACAASLCADEEEWHRRGHLFVVADGMGGHAVGELASKIAVETVPHTFYKAQDPDTARVLKQAIQEANAAIHRRGSENRDFQRMGTTCSAMALTARGLMIAHVGDSRVYRIRRDRIDQLTFDHSLVWELQRRHPKAAASMNLAEHKNVITRSLGPESEVEVDFEGPFPIHPGDIYVLCTDGLSGPVSDEEIGGIVRELSPNQACRLLVHLANLRGGADNCTVQVVRIGDLAANVPPAVIEPEEPQTESLGWAWLAAFWVAALVLVGGLSLVMFGRLIEGGAIAGLASLALVLLTWFAWRKQRRAAAGRLNDSDDPSRTQLLRPHRTAIVMPSHQLYERLLTLESEVRRAAEEERWDVDWKTHEQALKAALRDQEQKRYMKAVRNIARAIDVLITELPSRKPAQM